MYLAVSQHLKIKYVFPQKIKYVSLKKTDRRPEIYE